MGANEIDELAEKRAYLTGGDLNCDTRTYLGYIDGTITDKDGMPKDAGPLQILIHREHRAYQLRKRQNEINLLGLKGGRPYVEGRLSRYAGESTIDWVGGKRSDGSCATGRLQQTHAFPYLGRIANKICQYVFAEYPTREGEDEEVINDITRDGQSVNDIMRKVANYKLATDGSWIGIHAPAAKEDGSKYSILEKELKKLRPYWQVYSPLDVPDWKYDSTGNLLWLITRGVEVDDVDPFKKPEVTKVVKLWQRGSVTIIRIKEDKEGPKKQKITSEEVKLSVDFVPFVQCGLLSGDPIGFDDLESINRTLMDLGSVDRANFYKRMYPQMILPESIMTNAASDMYGMTQVDCVRAIVGMSYPIAVGKDDCEPKYIMPDATAVESVGRRIDQLKQDMFEVVGLALENTSRQVASAESKAWDNLDVSAVMREFAESLEDVERKCAIMTNAYDSSISVWEPKYNRNFDVGDFEQEIKAIVMLANMPQPIEATRHYQKKALDRSERIGSRTDQKSLQIVIDAIDNFEQPAVDVNEFGNNEFGDE